MPTMVRGAGPPSTGCSGPCPEVVCQPLKYCDYAYGNCSPAPTDYNVCWPGIGLKRCPVTCTDMYAE